MFIDVYLPPGLPVDRDEIEEEFEELDGFEVVGAGVGEEGANIDLEIDPSVPREAALREVVRILDNLGVADRTRLRLSDTGESVNAADLVG
ncbi:hypothetical protein [Micromonospora sp. NPDC050200]|uniref:hypothetical protein n=1 Tax=Micromonospora sp. NPDC050200 TaxID=3155664 RepID=UPI0033FAFCD0